ncbi:nucleolar DEAD-box protein required for synthesis of 60S ribosomal subunit [Neophaeococcomyces mojaviensis]|uniref:Nucleolar DEAD-box protein required for synthesis of 60S ribosomal subunit n=1 Tax=Neophaeococcomyces mojaviensis TaxID=3383035 RepID=A0ACC2ZY12_9EURO|nr:nucleolar DEAD-box protein required for synthesis of 60S ribosomal subunit [Knufia sp. JES_112]
MPSRTMLDEEFVLTISDNDELNISEPESTSDAEEAAKHQESKKRKRAGNAVKKNAKKQRLNQAVEEDSESDTGSGVNEGVKDGALDSDFEFDVGVNGAVDTVEDFDGWGDVPSKIEHSRPTKRVVDVDEIITRRAQKKSLAKNKAQQKLEDETGGNEDDVDSEAQVEIDFDDENLQADTFGAGAISEEDDVELSDQQSLDGAEEDEDAEEDVNSEDSDNSSAASPMAHPDDVASDAASDDESQTSHSDAEEAAKRKAFFASETDHTQASNTTSTNSFQQFSLSRPLLRALASLSFTTPTPIQARTIPIALQGLDVVGSAQTGSGKTAAFLLPILERLLYRPRKIPTTRVTILMPTRELAVQCHSVAVALAKHTDITFALVVGGFSLREQEVILKKRPDVVIATPGRFIDHMRNSASFTVENIEIMVLDEADRMLEQGFTDELDEILKTIPRNRQTMLFSATMTSNVDKLVRVGMNKPVRVSVDTAKSTVAGLTQEFLRLRPGRDSPELRLATLCTLVTSVADYQQRTIIFFRQKKEAHRIRIVFGLLGLKAGELHGSMTQDQRISAVNGFRDGRTTHLLATDVASRGLDIKNVLSVINYEAPQTHEIYLHRVGRTARAGKSGKSCTLAAEPDRKVVKAAVKSARSQGAKVTSRVLEQDDVNAMNSKLTDLATDIEDILKEEKAEKHLAQMESEVTRGQNMVRHHDEIMARPKRTWFESEREKQANKDRARAEEMKGVVFKGEKKKPSNKDKKKLDLERERKEGRQWKKGKEDAAAAGKPKAKGKKDSGSRKPGASRRRVVRR